MRNKLTKFAASWKRDMILRLNTGQAMVQGSITGYNQNPAGDNLGPLTVAVEAYNGVVADSRDLMIHVLTSMQHFINEHGGEQWVHTDAGASYGFWRDQWEDAADLLEDLDFARSFIDLIPGEPIQISSPEEFFCHRKILEDLPNEVKR